MKPILLALSTLAMIFAYNTASARDTRHMLSFQDAMSTADARAKLDGDMQFHFGSSPSGKVVKRHGEFTTNKKTNAFRKSDTEACNWAFLSAMLALQDRARREGANAVVNIRSYYKGNEVSNTSKFECGAGAVIAGVALKGEVVTLKQ